jgi:hypothetical protein
MESGRLRQMGIGGLLLVRNILVWRHKSRGVVLLELGEEHTKITNEEARTVTESQRETPEKPLECVFLNNCNAYINWKRTWKETTAIVIMLRYIIERAFLRLRRPE